MKIVIFNGFEKDEKAVAIFNTFLNENLKWKRTVSIALSPCYGGAVAIA